MKSPRRSKSLSSHSNNNNNNNNYQQQPQSIQSLDLQPIRLNSLHSTLNQHLKLVQTTLQLIISSNHQPPLHQPSNRSSRSNSTNTNSTQSSSSSSSSSSSQNHHDHHYHQLLSSLLIIKDNNSLSSEGQHPLLLSNNHQLATLTTFIHQLTHYINQLKLDLSSTHQLISHSTTPTNTFYLKPLNRLADCLTSIPDTNQLIHRLTLHSQNLNQLLSQLTLLSQYPSLPIITLPESLSNSSAHRRSLSFNHITPEIFKSFPTPHSLRQYFSEESERLASLLPALPSGLSESLAQSSNQITSALRACKEEAQAVLHDGELFIREEGEKLKGWVDSETEKLRLALQMGASRLLTYHELPEEWKNNQFIVKGYRFIPLDRWHHLLLSGIQWHNETINIHTHFFGTLSLFYLLFFLWPTTPHTAPDSSTLTDRMISMIFLVCAIKCLICSTAWHLFSGCGTLGPFRRLACVDYVGISGLIAASVMSMEYYGFYCRPALAGLYMSFTVAMGIIGMILPFQPFFDRPESKGIRIVFFVSMAGSALIPQAHMAFLYGLQETFSFYSPALPSVFSYLAGLFFYATNWPERIRPGWVFDTLFHSHQFWHVAIVAAIWLHWRAIGIIHDSGRHGFSCSPQAIHHFHQTANAFPPSNPFPSLISHWLSS